MAIIVYICIWAGLSVSAAYPVLHRAPSFGFDTLGAATFAHITSDRPFNDTELAFLKRYPIVQFDKGQDDTVGHNLCAEDRFIMAAKQIKAVNPNAFCLYYQNLLIAFTIFQRITNITEQAPHRYYAVDSKGEFVKTKPPYKTFDHTIAATRNLFVEDCLYGINSGVFDGCFIDRANYAQSVMDMYNGSFPIHNFDYNVTQRLIKGSKMALSALMEAVGQDNIILAKETSYETLAQDWQEVNGMMVTDTFCSEYDRGNNTKPYDPKQCQMDIETVRNASRRGQLTQSHGMGYLNDTTARTFNVACFLVAHGNMSYYSYASCEEAESWSLDGTRWWPEYDYPLGDPNGEATVSADGWTYNRSFASGTNVTVDIYNKVAHIEWARDDARTAALSAQG